MNLSPWLILSMCCSSVSCVCQLEEGEALDRVLLYCQAATGRLMLELRKVTNQDLYVKAGGFQKSWFTSRGWVRLKAPRAGSNRGPVND